MAKTARAGERGGRIGGSGSSGRVGDGGTGLISSEDSGERLLVTLPARPRVSCTESRDFAFDLPRGVFELGGTGGGLSEVGTGNGDGGKNADGERGGDGLA